MSKYLTPLWVFAGGQLLLLILWIFIPAIGEAGSTLAAATAEHASTFWGWSWASNSLKILVVVVGELFVLYATFKAILATKS